jgi:hypothetical protein
VASFESELSKSIQEGALSKRLSVVPATGLQPPRKLGASGLELWTKVQSEFAIQDCGGIELLLQCCLASDRADALAARIDADGEVIETKFGLKAHPCLKDELAARAFIVRTLQRLGLNLEPTRPTPGRPGVGRGWQG